MRVGPLTLIILMGVTIKAIGLTGTYIEFGGGYVAESGLPGAPADLKPGLGLQRSQTHLGDNILFGYNYDITQQFGLGAEVGWTYYGKIL